MPTETLHLRDPRDIRALAHPARMAIIDALASGDELTATECAAITGLSPSATAYHLKLLERYHFAERAPLPAATDGRGRGGQPRGPRVDARRVDSGRGGGHVRRGLSRTSIAAARSAEGFLATAHEEPTGVAGGARPSTAPTSG